MEQNPEERHRLKPPVIEPARQIGTPAGKVQRVAQHTQGLVEDIKAWVDLKIELTQLRIRARMESKANDVALGVMMAVLGLLILIFALVTLALGLGAWLGHPAWGFLIVTVLLAVGAGVLWKARPKLVQFDAEPSPDPEPKTYESNVENR